MQSNGVDDRTDPRPSARRVPICVLRLTLHPDYAPLIQQKEVGHTLNALTPAHRVLKTV